MGIEHRPWVGNAYPSGIQGKRIAVVGNSHWLRVADGDEPGFTEMVVAGVAAGTDKQPFFTAIPSYFSETHNHFWSSVLFFNYAPRAIGEGHQRYDKLTPSMAEEAKIRFKKILADHKPDKVFIFSDSIRWALPLMHLSDPKLPIESARIGHLVDDANAPPMYLLRHTQGAPKVAMSETVSALMAI